MYALLALTSVDLGLSGRAPPTIALAALRCVSVIAVMLLFTTAVLAPCPYALVFYYRYILNEFC